MPRPNIGSTREFDVDLGEESVCSFSTNLTSVANKRINRVIHQLGNALPWLEVNLPQHPEDARRGDQIELLDLIHLTTSPGWVSVERAGLTKSERPRC